MTQYSAAPHFLPRIFLLMFTPASAEVNLFSVKAPFIPNSKSLKRVPRPVSLSKPQGSWLLVCAVRRRLTTTLEGDEPSDFNEGD